MSARGLRRGNWSVQELERLRQLLPRRGVDGTALLLRRSPESVQRKALERLRVPPRRGDWTASDDGLLREAWGALDLRLLATLLGRPAAEVRRRAEVLRAAVRGGAWHRDEVALLKDLYGTRRDTDLEVCFSRPLAAVRAKASELCLAKDKRFVSQEVRRRSGAAAVADVADGVRMPRWRPEEIARLRELYADHENLTVARELGRSVNGVANKAHQLGLAKSPALLAVLGRANVAARYSAAEAVGVPTRDPSRLGAADGMAAADEA